MSAKIHIGTSGWHYTHWRGPFYPADIPADAMLSFFARRAQQAFIYFDNDHAGFAAMNAEEIQAKVIGAAE